MNYIAKRARQASKKLIDLLRWPVLLDLAFAVMFLFARRVEINPGAASCHFVVPAPGNGNIGDRALLEAFVEYVEPQVIVVQRSSSSYEQIESTEVLVLPHLIYGRFPWDVRDAARLMRAARGAASFSIIGADVMDGAYSWQASCRRSITAKWMARLGLSSRVVGFSWNSRPRPSARNALRRASRGGVRVFPRDSVSAARLYRDGIANITESADIVFTASRIDVDYPAAPPGGGPSAVVNVSSYVSRNLDQTEACCAVVRLLISRGMFVYLLPHVVRDGGDLEPLTRVYEHLAPAERERVKLIDAALTPAQVRAVAKAASVVVTQRMHLAVMSLRQGTPAVVVSTQGKVEGLMELFGILPYMVDPAEIAEGGLEERTVAMLDDLQECERVVAAAVPRVVRLAEQSFDGLPRASAT